MSRTVLRAVQILEHISEQPDGATIAELIARFGFPKTSIYNILTTLVRQDLLYTKRSDSHRFYIGVKAFIIGNKFGINQELASVARDTLQNLSRVLSYTTFLAIENKGYVVYLSKYEPESSVFTTATLGSRKPMYCTGLGKAILAAYSEEEVEQRLKIVPIKRKTVNTISDRKQLLQDLEQTRRRQFAFDDREQEDTLRCVAAPIHNHEKVVGAISTAFVYSDDDDIPGLGQMIGSAAITISQKLGYQKMHLYPCDG